MRIYSQETGQVILTRNVTWQYVLHTNPSPAQQTILSPHEGREEGDIADDGWGCTSRPGGGGDY